MKLSGSIQYRLHRYFAGNKPLIPVLFIAAMIGFLYSIAPMNVVSGYTLSQILLFCLMVFVALHMDADSDLTEEQLLFLRAGGSAGFYLSRELTMAVICLVYTLAFSLGPILANITHHFSFFIRPLTLYDVVSGFFLMLCGAVAGGVIGDLLNSRVVKDRKAGIMVTIVLAVATIASEGIFQEFPGLHFLKILFFPVMRSAAYFHEADKISLLPLLLFWLQTICFGTLLIWAKILVMKRHRFE